MSALQSAWEALLEASQSEGPNPALVDHATMAVIQLGLVASEDEMAALLGSLAEGVRGESVGAAAALAMCGGALIEQGAPAAELAEALRTRLPEVLSLAVAHADAVEALGTTATDDAHGQWVGDFFAPAEWIRTRFQTHSDQVLAWHQLGHFCLPLIAAATRDRTVLERLTLSQPSAQLDRLRHLEPHVRFLYLLQRMLLDTQLRFLHAPSGRVFDLRIDCVATNFELHTLLTAALAGPLDLEPPPPELVACLRGLGPRQLLIPSESTWALYTGQAYADLLAGNRVGMDRWVWTEAIPAEIPEILGSRAIVADEQSFQRQWESGRTFAALGAGVHLICELDEAEAATYRDELERASAKRS